MPAATFNYPYGSTTDGTNLYVADSSNNTIREINLSTAAVTTLAGTAGVGGSTNGTGAAASFSFPTGVTVLGGNLYVADFNNCEIRKIVIATGVVTTFAGSPGSCGIVDGTGTAAEFSNPLGITTDGKNLYVAGYNAIRKINVSTKKVTTLAGSLTSGSADGTGTAASFNDPTDITTDGTNLYVADQANCKIRKIVINSAVVTTVAGSGACGNVNGTGTAAEFSNPAGITTDGTTLYVADFSGYQIQQIK